MQQPCEVARHQHIGRMAGNNEFLITDIVGEKAFNDLMKLQGELKATTTLYAAFATEIANASKSNPKTFEELTAKANGFATTLGKLNDASGEMTRIQQQQLTVLKQVSVQLNNTGGLNKLSTLMDQFTKNVQAASEALGRLSAKAFSNSGRSTTMKLHGCLLTAVGAAIPARSNVSIFPDSMGLPCW